MTRIFPNPARVVVGGAALAAALGLAACAPMEEPETDGYDAALANLDTSRACFFTREINGFSRAPGSTARAERIYLTTGPREEWLLETLGSCPNLDFSLRLGLDTRGDTSVCTGDVETLVVPSTTPGDFDRCTVRVLGRVIEERD